MEWYEDPNRAREEVRKAHWRGAARLLGGLLAILVPAAIIFPVFAQTKWSGPKTNPETIAYAIMRVHERNGRWTESFADVGSAVHGRGPSAPYRVGFVKLAEEGGTAEYAIAVNGSLRHFRLGPSGRAESIGAPPAFGILKP